MVLSLEDEMGKWSYKLLANSLEKKEKKKKLHETTSTSMRIA